MSLAERLERVARACYEEWLTGTGAICDRRSPEQVFPRRERHVNIHLHCLHLWACLEPQGDGLPDFGKDGTI